MAIPVKFQQFKSAGIYRLVYDKSVISGVEAELLRLVVGYSPKGPFNTPVYIKTVSEFTAMFGGISKTLEKRGCFFHRTCIQALEAGPILCLNLKKFANEQVNVLDISSSEDIKISTERELKVTDIYDRSRFWKLEPEKLETKDILISMCNTDSIESTGTVFIRKAPLSKVRSYNMSLEEWYKAYNQETPEYIANSPELLATLLSDLFTEIYVFSGKFDETVFSTSLAKYFQKEVTEILVSSKQELLDAINNPKVTNITLDSDIELDNKPVGEDTSNHYRGGLLIKSDKVIDLNGHTLTAGVATETTEPTKPQGKATITNKYSVAVRVEGCNVIIKGEGTIKTKDAYYSIAVWAAADANVIIENGVFYNEGDGCELIYTSSTGIVNIFDGTFNATTKKGVEPGTNNYRSALNGRDVNIENGEPNWSINVFGGKYLGFNPANNLSESPNINYIIKSGLVQSNEYDVTVDGSSALDKVVSFIDKDTTPEYGDKYFVVKVAEDVLARIKENIYSNEQQVTRTITASELEDNNTLGFYVKDYITNAFGDKIDALEALFNDSASGALAHYIGCVLPDFIDPNNGYVSIDVLFNSQSDIHKMMMNINYDLITDNENVYPVLINNSSLKDGIENKCPYTLNGYSFTSKPESSTIEAKLKWQNSILNILTEEEGLRKALISNSEIEFRYIVDSFETYPIYNSELKSQLSLLAKEKELCFSILNFPSVRTMSTVSNLKNSKGLFDVNKVVNYLLLPSEVNGASFCAFYTPLKFSDGYVDTIVPSAGLVSNLFINKYTNRQPYSIIAGPNYSNIQYSQLVGPDYHYSQEELHVIEPFGVNCMIYRPTFGTFINANQTAKQLPKSALSAINVRELVIYLQDAIGKVLQSYQWEFNNANTRSAIKTQADLICENAKFNGGIQAYVNVIDETNNTPDLIDQEFCVLSTSIEPGRGCGKMVHELTIYKTGGLSAVIKE